MDHLDFPESSLSTHRINYSLPRSSHVTDADFEFVMLADKSRLSLNPYIYGARPVRQKNNYAFYTIYLVLASNNCKPFYLSPYTSGWKHFYSTNDPPLFTLLLRQLL